ncbi:MAG TPA: extracellular solute-binding protein [Actinospica sp.]|nr:extracellular solute-binding protein [Actinospica sp.]
MRRRSFLASALVAAPAAATLAGCGVFKSDNASSAANSTAGANGSVAPAEVRVYVSGDVNVQNLWNRILGPQFSKAFPGFSVKTLVEGSSVSGSTVIAKLGAAVKTNQDPGMDVLDGSFTTAATGGLLAKVSTSTVPNIADVSASLLAPVDYASVPYRGSAVVLAYNSKYVATPPTTLDELLAWITANPGKFTYNSPNSGGSGAAFVATTLAKYVPAADQAKMVAGYAPNLEGDWNQGFATLKGLGSSIYQHVYPNGNQAVLDLLNSGTIHVAPVWSDMALAALADGGLPSTVKLTTITDPTFTGGAAYLGVPTNAPNKAAALKLINWVLEPAQQETIVKVLSGYPAIKTSLLSASVQSKFAGLDTSNLRAGYSTEMATDMNSLWQQKVA